MKEYIEHRKQRIEDPNYKGTGDMVEILLCDPLSKDNHQLIIEECITFNIAGTLTLAMVLSNTFMYLT